MTIRRGLPLQVRRASLRPPRLTVCGPGWSAALVVTRRRRDRRRIAWFGVSPARTSRPGLHPAELAGPDPDGAIVGVALYGGPYLILITWRRGYAVGRPHSTFRRFAVKA